MAERDIDTHEGTRAFIAPTAETLVRCEDEPIRTPEAIQPHGCLFEVQGEELVVARVTSNVRSTLGLAPADVLDRSFRALVGDATATTLNEQLGEVAEGEHVTSRAAVGDRSGTVVAHRYRGKTLVEWLIDREHRLPAPDRFDAILSEALADARAPGRSVEAALDCVARGVHAAAGYDRVMVYRFHPDWHGEVVAECLEPGQIPYLGLHYPASDIPAQARDLYIETRARLIVDAYAHDPIFLESKRLADADRLDLSRAVLRSVSPVHLQYLRNMGTGATFVSSLVIDGKLWGLISCHHRAAYPVPWYAFERLRRFTDEAAAVIGDVIAAQREERKKTQDARMAKLDGSIASSPRAALPILVELLDASGGAVVGPDGSAESGDMPVDPSVLAAIAVRDGRAIGTLDALAPLAARHGDAVQASEIRSRCAGLAWAVIAESPRLVAIFVRPEFQRTVTWGGDPNKAVLRDPVTRRLSPRGSFELWRETVEDRSRPWGCDALEVLGLLRRRADHAAWSALD